MPTLVLVGEKSPKWFHNSMEAVALALPNAGLAAAARQTHMVKPKILAPQLTEFYATPDHADRSELASAEQT